MNQPKCNSYCRCVAGESDGADFASILASSCPNPPSQTPLATQSIGQLEALPRERAFGGLLAITLCGLTSGHLSLDLEILEPYGAYDDDIQQKLDQFGPSFSVRVCACVCLLMYFY